MIVIVDYGLGNLGSIANMLKKVGAAAQVSSDPAVIAAADQLILPGIGAFDNGMRLLNERGLVPLLSRLVLEQGVPVLGLCLGMQLFASRSEEGVLPGLGWIDAEVRRFHFAGDQPLRVPHMGWNTARPCRSHPLFEGEDPDPRYYFVHSFHMVCNDGDQELARTTYGYEFASAVAHGNILGVQFHPEKSHRYGMRLLKNFAERC